MAGFGNLVGGAGFEPATLASVAVDVMKKDGYIRLGMFVYALKHGPKHKCGMLLEPYRKHFAGMTDKQLAGVYEAILVWLDLAFPGMTCGIESWSFEFGYTTTPIPRDASNWSENRWEQRAVDLKLARHPDARSSIRGTRLPNTTWYRNPPTPSYQWTVTRQAA